MFGPGAASWYWALVSNVRKAEATETGGFMRAVRGYAVEAGDKLKREFRVEPVSGGVALAIDFTVVEMTADQALDLARALQQAAKDHNDISNVEDDGA